FHDQVYRLFARQALTVLAVFAHGIKAVYDRQYSRGQRYCLTDEPVGVTSAIPPLMMVAHDRHDGVREFDAAEDLRACNGVKFHLLELGGGQLTGLVE